MTALPLCQPAARPRALLWGLQALAGLPLTAALALAVGITAVPLADLPGILAGEGGGRVHRIVVWELRLPRILARALAGAALGAPGALLQDSLRNPLAEPGLLGVASGASLVVAVVVVLDVAAPPGSLPLLALLGGLGAGLAILGVTRLTRDPVRMILVGAALSALFSALIAIVVVLGSPEGIRALTTWLVGSLVGAAGRISAPWHHGSSSGSRPRSSSPARSRSSPWATRRPRGQGGRCSGRGR